MILLLAYNHKIKTNLFSQDPQARPDIKNGWKSQVLFAPGQHRADDPVQVHGWQQLILSAGMPLEDWMPVPQMEVVAGMQTRDYTQLTAVENKQIL